jgi:calcium-dependent protein kinase
MEQLFSAVTYLHSKQVVHRDLKPENILLSSRSDQERPHLTIIDFETAALMDIQHQLSGSFGTVYYMAPEVLDGRYDEKCDLWSLGVIMYILLTGKPPFDGQTERHIARSVKQAVYSLEGPEWEYVSSEAKDLIQKLLMKNPKVRISAREAVLHPWIQIYSRKLVPSNAACSEVMCNLKSFYHLNKLKGAIHTFILTQVMDQQEVQEMREMFNHIDKDRDGVINVQDLMGQISVLKPLEDPRECVQQLM